MGTGGCSKELLEIGNYQPNFFNLGGRVGNYGEPAGDITARPGQDRRPPKILTGDLNEVGKMPDEINVQAVIEQLMTRIAQLELEVAVLKSMNLSPVESVIEPNKPETPSGGYV